MKKLTAILLTACMLLSLLPTAVFAQETLTLSDVPLEETVETPAAPDAEEAEETEAPGESPADTETAEPPAAETETPVEESGEPTPQEPEPLLEPREETPVALVGDTAYDDLAQAIREAEEGQTVTVLKDVTLEGAVNPGKDITIEGRAKADGTKPVISGGKGLFSFTKGSATVRDLELRATANSWYIYHSAGEDREVRLTVTGCDFTMAGGVISVGNLVMTEGFKPNAPVIFVGNRVEAHSRVALAGPGDNSEIRDNDFNLESEAYGDSRTSVIGLTATEETGSIVVTGNLFMNANRALGVDNSFPGIADRLVFERNAFVNCLWALEFDSSKQGVFDIRESYYQYKDSDPREARAEDSSRSGSHHNPDDVEYVPAEGEEPRVIVSSYYTEYDIDSRTFGKLETSDVMVAQAGEGDEARLYLTLQAAIDGAGSEETTITLLRGTTENITVAEEQRITLDLNGQTLNGKLAAPGNVVTNNGTLTIRDSGALREDGMPGGRITRDETGITDHKGHNYIIMNTGALAVEGGHIYSQCGRSNAPSVINNKGNGAGKASMLLEGGLISSSWGIVVKMDDNSELTMTGGKIQVTSQAHGEPPRAWAGIQNWATATITGGEIEGLLPIVAYSYTDGGNAYDSVTTIDGDVVITGQIQAVRYDNGDSETKIQIKGGDFRALTVGEATYEQLSLGQDGEKAGEILVSGGSFELPVEKRFCAEGFVPVENEDGTYGVSTSLTLSQTALAMTVGYTVSRPVTLTADTTAEGEVTWASDDEAVATVAGGVVTPVGVGSANITAEVNGVTALCVVTVTNTTAPSGGGSSGGGSSGGEGSSGGSSGGASSSGTGTSAEPVEEELEENEVPLAQPLPFLDVSEKDWFYDAVRFAYDREMMKGTKEAIFDPDLPTNRAMIVTVLYRMEGEPAASAASAFSDVLKGVWYTNAVDWAAANGIVMGYGDGSFRPMKAITREEMATILSRYAAFKGYDEALAGSMEIYNDKTLVAGWAKKGMTWAVGAKVLRGKSGDLLDPKGNATRAEVAEMLKNFCETFETAV